MGIVKHGFSRDPIFRVWAGIIRRCYVEKTANYYRYGGAGVRVCDLWRYNFIEFYNWAKANGWRKGLEIDKDIIPEKLGIPAILYSPELCKIVSRKENANHTTAIHYIEYNGETKSLSAWAEHFGFKRSTFQGRVTKIGFEKAISEPTSIVRKRKKIVCETTGEIFESILEAARIKNIPQSSISRVLLGKRRTTHDLFFKYLN